MKTENAPLDALKIEQLPIDALVPYPNNPRNNDDAVAYVANSISTFGFKVPVVIDKNNVIVTGHTRVSAAKQLGMTAVPCIRADDLSDEQVRAFRIADNKVGEIATWDAGKLDLELGEIRLDMTAFGDFDLSLPEMPAAPDQPEPEEPEDDGYYGDERERTNRAYHLDLLAPGRATRDFWQMPTVANDGFIPDDLIGFNYAKTSDRHDSGIHFYLDDYQFERIWHYPEKYTEILSAFSCILTPDFSLYMDMPMPMKIWNTYRSRMIGAYYQDQGLQVIPTVSWAEPETFEFCFRGIPKGSIVSISTIGVKEDPDALAVWKAGTAEMLRQIEPSAVLIYGGQLDFDFGAVETRYYDNQVTENWKRVAKQDKE